MKFFKKIWGILAAIIAGLAGTFVFGSKKSGEKKQKIKEIKKEIKDKQKDINKKIEENKNIQKDIRKKEKELEKLKVKKEKKFKEDNSNVNDMFKFLKEQSKK